MTKNRIFPYNSFGVIISFILVFVWVFLIYFEEQSLFFASLDLDPQNIKNLLYGLTGLAFGLLIFVLFDEEPNPEGR